MVSDGADQKWSISQIPEEWKGVETCSLQDMMYTATMCARDWRLMHSGPVENVFMFRYSNFPIRR